MASQKIDPLSVITQHTPTPEQPKSASSWFKTERMELDFGDYVGRPSENVTAHTEALSQLLADGWYVTEVSKGGSSGEWKRVSSQKKSGSVSSSESRTGTRTGTETGTRTGTETGTRTGTENRTSSISENGTRSASESGTRMGEETSTSTGSETSNSSGSSEASGYSNATNNYNTFTNGAKDSGATSGGGTSMGSTNSNSSNSSSEDSQGQTEEESQRQTKDESQGQTQEQSQEQRQEDSQGQTEEQSQGQTQEQSQGQTHEQSQETSSGTQEDEETVSADETDPYWCAWQKIRLERRRMQAELVLQSMVDTFVANFNEGRKINVDRYEELVALYALMVSQTQDDAANIDLDSIDFEPLFDEVKAAIKEKLSEYQSVADQIPSDWLESRKADINLKFDNLIGEARAKMVSDGTYNGTVWPSVLAGIEHQRSHALDALKDESVTLKLSAYGDIAKTTAALYGQMIDAQVRVFEALKSKKTTPITLRNEVLKWMYDFMERRTDDHVKIEELATLVEQMGYDGGIVAPYSIAS
jgi:hypothetical protein